MAVIKMKPTSPGRRGMVKVTRDHLHKGEGFAPLLEPQFQKAGRNNNGPIVPRMPSGPSDWLPFLCCLVWPAVPTLPET